MSPSPATGSLLCDEDAGEAISENPSPLSTVTLWAPHDEESIAGLMDAEREHMPRQGYLRRCREREVDTTARLDAINWIFKVQALYEFQPVTAFLSINYMDRFLSSSCSFPRGSEWAYQLLSVACLSVAAKMEEVQVPLLVELQVLEPRFVFDPKTVERMELRLMSHLNWTLRSVTPFDYLPYFFNTLSSSSPSPSHPLSTASHLILATTRVIDFLEFTPSVVAAAAVLCSAPHSQLLLSFHRKLDHDMVRRCHQLMEEYVVDTCPASTHKAATLEEEPLPPQSPVGVLDAAATCATCDTSSERNYLGSAAQLQHQAEPPTKRLRSSAPDSQQR